MALSDADRRLVRLFAVVVLGRWEELSALRRSAPEGEPDRRWREALLQAHLFAGFPRLVEAYGVLARAGGLGRLEEGEALAEPDQCARGRELFERIYAGESDRVRAILSAAHPDFARWIEGHAYGRVLAREGLAADRRELLAVAGLAAQDQQRQLASHARGALRLGATRAELEETLVEIADLLDPQLLARSRATIDRTT
jgi:alkylhydroperoxidase/carboxymuconolactone decarboxylase family protein YurZ